MSEQGGHLAGGCTGQQRSMAGTVCMLEAGSVQRLLTGSPMGLAAATTEQRAASVVTMPALEMEILCCSMAS